jgi:flagellar hook-basal body complex protein FliE
MAIKLGVSLGAPAITPIKPEIKPADIKSSEGPKFGEMLKDVMKEVDTLQDRADKQINGLVTGQGNVTTHDAMIALEKADVAFQLMNQIRAKIVRAYEEVIRTQV